MVCMSCGVSGIKWPVCHVVMFGIRMFVLWCLVLNVLYILWCLELNVLYILWCLGLNVLYILWCVWD